MGKHAITETYEFEIYTRMTCGRKIGSCPSESPLGIKFAFCAVCADRRARREEDKKTQGLRGKIVQLTNENRRLRDKCKTLEDATRLRVGMDFGNKAESATVAFKQEENGTLTIVEEIKKEMQRKEASAQPAELKWPERCACGREFRGEIFHDMAGAYKECDSFSCYVHNRPKASP